MGDVHGILLRQTFLMVPDFPLQLILPELDNHVALDSFISSGSTETLFAMVRVHKGRTAHFVLIYICSSDTLIIYKLKQDILINKSRDWCIYVLPFFSFMPCTATNKIALPM